MKLFLFSNSTIAMVSGDSERGREKRKGGNKKIILLFSLSKERTFFRFIFSPLPSISKILFNFIPSLNKIESFTVLWLIVWICHTKKNCYILVAQTSIDNSLLWNFHSFPFHGQPRLFLFIYMVYLTCLGTSSLKIVHILTDLTTYCRWCEYNSLLLFELIIIIHSIYFEQEKKTLQNWKQHQKVCIYRERHRLAWGNKKRANSFEF